MTSSSSQRTWRPTSWPGRPTCCRRSTPPTSGSRSRNARRRRTRRRWLDGVVVPAGEHRAGRWVEVIDVGDRFHRAMAGLARPAFIAARTDPWPIGDRVAWGEAPIDPYLTSRTSPAWPRSAARSTPKPADPRRPHAATCCSPTTAAGRHRPVAVLAPDRLRDRDRRGRCARLGGRRRVAPRSVADVDDIGQMLIRALLFDSSPRSRAGSRTMSPRSSGTTRAVDRDRLSLDRHGRRLPSALRCSRCRPITDPRSRPRRSSSSTTTRRSSGSCGRTSSATASRS